MKGAKCPHCKERWYWDVKNETYRTESGEWIQTAEEIINFQPIDMNEPIPIIIVYRCGCKTIVSIGISDQHGYRTHIHPAWNGIDWYSDDYSYSKLKEKA